MLFESYRLFIHINHRTVSTHRVVGFSEFISSDPKSDFKKPRWNKKRFGDERKIPWHNTRLHVCRGNAIFERADACHIAAVHLLDVKLVRDLFFNLSK